MRGAALALTFCAVLGFDLARATVGVVVRPCQWVACGALLAVLVSSLRARGLRFREWLPWVALAALLVPTAVDHARRLEPGDSVHYYSYLHSVMFDGDLALANDYRLLGWAHPDMPNVLPVGAPLAWAPLLVPIHLGRQMARLFGAAAPDGSEPLYQAAVALATFLYGAAALFLLFDTLRRWVGPAAAFWTTVLVWVGSPLRFYLAVLPGMAHGFEFFAAVLVLRTYLRLREAPSPRTAAWAGAACGLVFLARSQDGLLLALPLVELARQALRGPRRRTLELAAILCGAFLLAALPQLVVWQIQFGVPILVPHTAIHGAEFLHPGEPRLLDVLTSPRGGLFLSYPVLLLACAGLVALFARDPAYVIAVLPVLLASWYLNASVFDWYQVRRFTGLVPLLAPGLALLSSALVRAGTVAMVVVAILVLRFDLAVDALRRVPGDPAPAQRVLATAADALAADAYRAVEPWSPSKAVALLSAYTGDGVLEGPVSRIDLGTASSLLLLPRAARNLSEPSVEDGVACRWVTDRDARFFLPLSWSGPVIVTLKARALETEGEQAMELRWNEVAVGKQVMRPAWEEYRFRVPSALVRKGTNVVGLAFDRGPIYHRARGQGPREVRPAALAAITLHRE